ncbi:MAG: threonine synthase [Oscillospiraceae bacterium]|nr:threonine synthase [Oscillospiraceae bacterium]
MTYFESTRSGSKADGLTAVLEGIAEDGGLFVDPNLQEHSLCLDEIEGKSSFEISSMILHALLPGFEDPEKLVQNGYQGKFSCGEILTPLVRISDDFSVLELFHGPTSAFKDVALSLLPLLMSEARRRNEPEKQIVILTATSGDTGKAALEGFRDVSGIRILVFYPENGVSEVQRKQMVSQEGRNVRVCAVKGNFDDCQTAVKKAFLELKRGGLLQNVILTSANSINIGRLVPQIFYYFSAYTQLLAERSIQKGELVDFSVPTGNFGDILAGYYAKKMGLPVGKLICASNQNRILTDFLRTGEYDTNRTFHQTSSPSMDILVSSNLERLLYYVSEGDKKFVSDCMQRLSTEGKYKVSESTLKRLQEEFCGYTADEEKTVKCIRKVFEEHGYLLDPHTAVAWSAAEQYKKETNSQRHMVVLSTASPYTFTDVVCRALGLTSKGTAYQDMRMIEGLTRTEAPRNLLKLESSAERFQDVIGREEIVSYVQKYIEERGEL